MGRSKYLIGIAVCMLCDCGNSTRQDGTQDDDFDFKIKTIKTGKQTGSVEIADVDKDGDPDAIVANSGDSTLSVLLNDGIGNFKNAAGSPFFTNRFPNDIAITDINRDGNPDLVVANTEVSLLTVFTGNGRGQFQQVQHSPFHVHSRPHTHGIATGDFDGNGTIDLATDDWGENKIVILFNDGHEDFSNEHLYRVGKRPYQRLRSGDLNADGKPDIVTTNLDGNNVTILLGEGHGKFHEPSGSPVACGTAPFGVAIGDVNGDDHPDLMVVDSPTITSESKGRDGLWILAGDGAGGFSTLPGSPFPTGKSPSRVAMGDLDGDGVNDIVATNYNDKSITVFLMGKAGVRKSKTIAAGNYPDGIVVADINHDRHADILVGNSGDDTLMIFFSK